MYPDEQILKSKIEVMLQVPQSHEDVPQVSPAARCSRSMRRLLWSRTPSSRWWKTTMPIMRSLSPIWHHFIPVTL